MTADLLRATGYPHAPQDARLVLATVEGLAIEALVEGRATGEGVLAETVTRVFAALGSGPAGKR